MGIIVSPTLEHGSEPPDAMAQGAAGADALPRRFGRYVLLRPRAVGGMAELDVAVLDGAQEFGETVVIKRVLPSLAEAGDHAALGRMLMNEARIVGALSHPNVARALDAGCIDGVHFIALEHVQGEDLRSIVRQMRQRRVAEFPVEHALTILLGVLSGLTHVHERRGPDGQALGIVHRDVSPQNVLVTFAGEVKLVDFGIAMSLPLLGDEVPGPRPKGKLPYMSPEQARGDRVDARSDVFSAGIILFELTTGRRLFKAAGERETLELLLERDYPRPSDLLPGYSTELETIVVRALARDPAARWPSARAMHEALEELVRVEQVATSAPSLGQLMTSLFEAEIAQERAALTAARKAATRSLAIPGP
jgi:eukaryotic-like serine/threonine-protein kinase